MNEGMMSADKVWASLAWSVTVGLILAAWITIAVWPPPNPWGYMLALTSGVLAPFAATLHVRIYMARMYALIRTHNVAVRQRQAGDSDVRPLR